MSIEVQPAVAVTEDFNGELVEDGEVVNGNSNVLFSKDSVQNVPVKEGRIIKKAKRPSKQLQKIENSPVNGLTAAGANTTRLPFTKNSKQSRNFRGRGLPKKGGAGGKGVWGKPGSELFVTGECSDILDPNYDSDSQDAYKLQQIQPVLSEEEVHHALEPLFQEYLENGDTEEVLENLSELNFGPNKHKIPGVAVSLAIDRHNPQREMTSCLISDMYGCILTQEEMAKGFDDILHNLADLTLDAPEAPTVVGQFIARAIADDCLLPRYVKSYKGNLDCPHAQSALDKADVLLSMNHGIVRLDNVWGVGGGNRPVKYLIKRMVLLLKEYMSSGDIEEAVRCLQELDVPHFHHELVYECVIMALEDSTDRANERMVDLMKHMHGINIITPDQMKVGVKRVFENMPDIAIDVPQAYMLLERLGNKMYTAAILPEIIYKDLPVRGRKRFVSEGDGGRIKEQALAAK